MSIAPTNHTQTSESSDSWITPRWLIEKIGPFDLDPCACDPQPWPCAVTNWTGNGLMLSWFGFVYCNPPYGRSTEFWLEKMAAHKNGIALVFARTETKTFFKCVWPFASAMIFLRGRLTFNRPDGSEATGNSGGPSVLIGYGQLAWSRLAANRQLGAFVSLDRGTCR